MAQVAGSTAGGRPLAPPLLEEGQLRQIVPVLERVVPTPSSNGTVAKLQVVSLPPRSASSAASNGSPSSTSPSSSAPQSSTHLWIIGIWCVVLIYLVLVVPQMSRGRSSGGSRPGGGSTVPTFVTVPTPVPAPPRTVPTPVTIPTPARGLPSFDRPYGPTQNPFLFPVQTPRPR
jgi:hypothetical protein